MWPPCNYQSCYRRRVMSCPSPSQCWLAACVDGLWSDPMNVVGGLLHCWACLSSRKLTVWLNMIRHVELFCDTSSVSSIRRVWNIIYLRSDIPTFCLATLPRPINFQNKRSRRSVSSSPSFRCIHSLLSSVVGQKYPFWHDLIASISLWLSLSFFLRPPHIHSVAFAAQPI